MGLLDGLFRKEVPGAQEVSEGSAHDPRRESSEKPAAAAIKKVYSFVSSTVLLDLSTPMGKAMVDQIHPYACQQLSAGDTEFRRLYAQVENENAPHELGTGVTKSSADFGPASLAWLKARGVHPSGGSDVGKQLFVFAGNAQHPQSGMSFAWAVSYYFDIES
jgi:hypothetical protein